MHTRVVLNQKVGVEIEYCSQFGSNRCASGAKTLLIDLDPQANSSQYLLRDDATYSSDKPALEPNIENYFEDVLGNQQSKSLIGNAIGSILKTRAKGWKVICINHLLKSGCHSGQSSLGTLAHALESSIRFTSCAMPCNHLLSIMTGCLLILRQHLISLHFQP